MRVHCGSLFFRGGGGGGIEWGWRTRESALLPPIRPVATGKPRQLPQFFFPFLLFVVIINALNTKKENLTLDIASVNNGLCLSHNIALATALPIWPGFDSRPAPYMSLLLVLGSPVFLPPLQIPMRPE